ncbi:MAG: hypothetical protein JST32_11345 [Bacteroidetes bacterium]|nr:hypothetical protein [Bacteroidota bacterium]
MRNKKALFSMALILAPIFAFASGDDVLTSFYVIGASIIFFLVALIALKLSYSTKSVLAIVYFLTLFLIIYITRDIPYRDNMNTINSCLGLIPIGVCLIIFLIVKAKNKKVKA